MTRHFREPFVGRWAKRARAVIGAALAGHDAATTSEKRRILRAAYPFGARTGWPYKVWCREVRAALKPAPTRRRTVNPKVKQLFELD